MTNKEEKKEKNKKIFIVLFVLIALAGALFSGLYLGGALQHRQEEKNPVVADGNKYANENDDEDFEENPSISIPCFDSVYLKADEIHQYFTFHNPEENTCYFEIVMTLEDGTVLWTSDYIEPGMAISEFDLNQSLPAGTYENATLTYNCYNLKTLAPFNNGAVKISIVVK